MPSLINSSGFGRCSNFCSKLSARICFSSSFCCPCIAGAAVESGSMFPVSQRKRDPVRQHSFHHFLWEGNLEEYGIPKGDGSGVLGRVSRSISSSLSGLFSKPFRRLSLACWRSNSNCADWRALFAPSTSVNNNTNNTIRYRQGDGALRCGVRVP